MPPNPSASATSLSALKPCLEVPLSKNALASSVVPPNKDSLTSSVNLPTAPPVGISANPVTASTTPKPPLSKSMPTSLTRRNAESSPARGSFSCWFN